MGKGEWSMRCIIGIHGSIVTSHTTWVAWYWWCVLQVLPHAIELCQDSNFEAPACAASVRDATITRICSLFHALQADPTTHLSTSFTTTASSFCDNPVVADPVTLKIKPLDGKKASSLAVARYWWEVLT